MTTESWRRVVRSPWWASLSMPGKVIGIGLLAFLLLWNQPYYPAPWFDEGTVLEGAKNIALFGEYAMRSSEGFRVLDQPLVANGPGVVLPVAVSFLLFGVGLMQARAVVVVSALLATGLFYTIARGLSGRVGAVIAIALLVGLPVEGFVLYGRHTLGIVPALACFLAGYLLWMSSLKHRRVALAVMGGILFGLAAVTKGQYGLLLPVLGLALLIERLWIREARGGFFLALLLAMTGTFFIWMAAQRILVGGEGYSEHVEAIARTSRVSIIAMRTSRIPGNALYLLRSGSLLLLLPGLVYAGWLLWRRNSLALAYLPLALLVVVWTAWYVFASVGFHRYAFEPYVAGLLLSAKLADDALDISLGEPEAGGRSGSPWRRPVALAYVGGLVLLATIGVLGQINRLATGGNAAVFKMAALMQDRIEPDALVESWEWELDALTTLTYHHPTNEWVDRYTAVLQFQEPMDASYDPAAFDPQYLVDGPFSKWTAVYSEFLGDGCCTLIYRVGEYDLYLVRPGS